MVWTLLSLALISCGRAQKTTADGVNCAAVPQEYRILYNELAAKLDHLGKGVKSQWKGKKAATAFGLKLLVASSNRGEVLLTDRVFKATVLTLDRLKSLGVRRVALSIQYPILSLSYQRSAEYSDFYKRVAQ